MSYNSKNSNSVEILEQLLEQIVLASFFFWFPQSKFLIPLRSAKPEDSNEVSKYWERMHKTLDAIENIWLDNGQKKYLCGDKISVADIVACCELEQPLMAG